MIIGSSGEMGFLFELRNRLRKSEILMFFVVLFVYFSYYTINGERGLRRYLHLKQEISYANQIADNYSKEKKALEEKIRLLSPSSLDLDMLDERARAVLNMAKEDEFVILDQDIE